jgi:hypothetical protein
MMMIVMKNIDCKRKIPNLPFIDRYIVLKWTVVSQKTIA